jgi:PAS domain S-box-containing protein
MGVEAALANQLDHIGDWGLLVTDAQLIVTGWNRWLEQRSGLPAAEVIGRPLFELFPDLTSRNLGRYYRQALAGKTALLSHRFHGYVLSLPSAVGGTGLDRMQQSARIVPVVNGSEVRGTLTVIEDVTERVAYEAELGSSARQQAALAAVARSALAGADTADIAREAAGHLRETVGAEFTEVLELLPDGRSWTTLAGEGWVRPTPPAFVSDYAPRTLAALRPDIATDEDVVDDLRLAADTYLLSHGVASGLVVLVRGRSTRPFGLLGAYTRSRRAFAEEDLQFTRALADILGVAAERKRLEGELRLRVGELADADRRKDEFLAMLAHELRNPLAPVRNAVQVLRMKCTDDPLVERMAEMMGRQVGHMSRLVDDLLDVSRITRGRVNLRRERVELATVVARAVESVRPLIDARGHELSISVPNEPVHLDADMTRLVQILGNLLNNASKYTPEGGHIWLTAYREGDDAVVIVRDNGIGIPAEMLPRVFDLFTQVDRTLDRSQGGLGIGLTLVRSLVELHGGSVKAASEGTGRGSEFIVRLPALPAVPQQKEERKADEGQSGSATPHRVLIVDDNVDSVESLAILLEMAGHDARTAHDGPTALETARAFRPRVVLLDIGLPRMDGYEVARRIRQEPGLAGTTLIALTGYGQEEDRRRSREAGFDRHLVKPVDPEELREVLRQLPPESKGR